ncbi:MAG: MBL fold metallo-hydrolase [Candidatus Rokuibacteriota bacterium]
MGRPSARRSRAATTAPAPGVRLTHLGAAGWEIAAGTTTILLDPYLSRLRYRARFGTLDTPALSGDTRRVFGPDDELVPDVAAIDARVTRADFILHSHSHFNHTLDMPHLARKTGATVVGSESTTNLARAGGVPEAQLVTVRGGEDYEFGAFSLKVVPSLHSALNGKHFFDARVVPRDFRGPRRMADDVEGGTLAYFLRLAGHRILWFGSMNYIEREVAGLRPDVALIAAARQRLEIHDYTGRLLRALGRPPLVIATHWDEQSLPFGAPQDERLREAEVFVAEVEAASPRTRVIVPRHFESFVLGGPDVAPEPRNARPAPARPRRASRSR